MYKNFSVFDHNDVNDFMKKIDNALPSAKLTPQNMSKVKELRAKGEEQHKAGQHTESMNTLAEAKKIIGVQ